MNDKYMQSDLNDLVTDILKIIRRQEETLTRLANEVSEIVSLQREKEASATAKLAYEFAMRPVPEHKRPSMGQWLANQFPRRDGDNFNADSPTGDIRSPDER